VIALISQLMVLLFLGAGVVYVIYYQQGEESFSQPLDYLDSFYFMITTASTIGYGDIYPKSFWAKIWVVLLILLVIIVFADNISKLADLLKRYNKYDRHYRLKNHIVLIGSLKIRDLIRFILGLIERHGFHDIPRVLVVGHLRIEDTEIEILMRNELLDKKLYYLSVEKGIDQMALGKANLRKAKAVYFLSRLKMDNDTEQHTLYLFDLAKQVSLYLRRRLPPMAYGQMGASGQSSMVVVPQHNPPAKRIDIFMQLSTGLRIDSWTEAIMRD